VILSFSDITEGIHRRTICLEPDSNVKRYRENPFAIISLNSVSCSIAPNTEQLLPNPPLMKASASLRPTVVPRPTIFSFRNANSDSQPSTTRLPIQMAIHNQYASRCSDFFPSHAHNITLTWDHSGEGVYWFVVESLRHERGQVRDNRPKVGVTPIGMTPVANFEIWSGPDTVYVINDNDGQLFDFEKLAQGETWVTRDALSKVGVNNPPLAAGGAPDRRALASVKPTDVLVLGIHTWPVGVNAVPLRVEGRAALYSLGFLLRRAAAVRLDIHERELKVGLSRDAGSERAGHRPDLHLG
jgi:hypothetical protein